MPRSAMEKGILGMETVSINRPTIKQMLIMTLQNLIPNSLVPGYQHRRIVLMNQHIIQHAISQATSLVVDGSYYDLTHPSLYHRRILEFVHGCMDRGMDEIPGLPCHWDKCINIIWEGQRAVSISKRHGRKYYHEECAKRLSLI
jgi:hypothetical protein